MPPVFGLNSVWQSSTTPHSHRQTAPGGAAPQCGPAHPHTQYCGHSQGLAALGCGAPGLPRRRRLTLHPEAPLKVVASACALAREAELRTGVYQAELGNQENQESEGSGAVPTPAGRSAAAIGQHRRIDACLAADLSQPCGDVD